MQDRNETNSEDKETQITGLTGMFSTKFSANKIFSFLSEQDINTLRQVSKPLSQAVTLHFFRHEPQNTKRRSAIFQFLSDTNRSLPQDVQPEQLFKALNMHDSLEDYLASLHHLLVYFKLETNLSQGIIDKLIKNGELIDDSYVKMKHFNMKIMPYLAPFFTKVQSIQFLNAIQVKYSRDDVLRSVVSLLPRIAKENKFFSNHLEVLHIAAKHMFSFKWQKENIFLYQRLIKLLMEYDYASAYIKEIASIVANPFSFKNKISFDLARILIGGLSSDAFNKVKLYDEVIAKLDDLQLGAVSYEIMGDYGQQLFLIIDKLEKLFQLMERSALLLSEEKQKSLAIKMLTSLSLIEKESGTRVSSIYLSMFYILTQLLQQPHNKALLNEETKKQLSEAFRLLENNDPIGKGVYSVLINRLDAILEDINLGSVNPFYLSDIVPLANLTLSQDEPCMLSLAINDYAKHRRPYFYPPLKAIYMAYLQNAENADEKMANNFLALTMCFHAELSREESDLAIDILIKVGIFPSDKDKKDNFFCFIELSQKTDENRLTKIKQLVVKEWPIHSHGQHEQFMFEQLTIHLIKRAHRHPAPSTVFHFDDQDIDVLTDCICKQYLKYSCYVNYVNNHNFKPFMMAFLKMLNNDKLKEFADKVKRQINNKGDINAHDMLMLIMHLIVKQFKERSISSDVSEWFEKEMNENVTFVIDSFKRDHDWDLSDTLSLLVLENDFDVTDLIAAFLNHYSAPIEKKSNVNFIQNGFDFAPNLMKRMNDKQLLALRDSLAKIVVEDDSNKKNSIVTLLKSAIFLTYDPTFDCAAALQPLFTHNDANQSLLDITSIICWQLLCKNESDLKINPSKESHLIVDLIDWIADKSQEIHKQHQLTIKNQQAPCPGKK